MGAPHVHVDWGLQQAAAEGARLREDGAPRGVCPRCVGAWSVRAGCATAPSVRIVGSRRWRWPS